MSGTHRAPSGHVGTVFAEIADRVFVARYPQWDLSVGLVVGDEAALVVDTRAGVAQAKALLADLRGVPELAGRPVAHVVNTHVHFDHTFGNAAFASAAIHAHANTVAAFDGHAAAIRAAMAAETSGSTQYGYTVADLADALASPLRAPDHPFAHGVSVQLGGREVVLRYGGRGHTDGDIAVEVIGAGVSFLGDLVEQSGPPSYGSDCWPLDWPMTLQWHRSQLPTGSLVVPGHGSVVDEAFMQGQLEQLQAVATVLRERVESGMPLARAVREPDPRLPWPIETMADAVQRAYAAR